MDTQNYKNHVRYYPPHHFILYPALLAMILFCVNRAFRNDAEFWLWMFVGLSFLVSALVSLMLRQHYALNNQNRIVRLEMRYRYFVLTSKRLELLEDALSFGQIAALRFASDQELPALLERALKERLSPDDIKKSIKNWQPDLMRV